MPSRYPKKIARHGYTAAARIASGSAGSLRLFFLPLLFILAGTLAVTQESPSGEDAPVPAAPDGGISEFAPLYGQDFEFPPEPPPDWVRSDRWFRSNAGGMMLEEIPSGLTALRNDYALVVDFAGREELPEMLEPFYEDGYFIETRTLYEHRNESRRQWIFRDRNGLNRLVAVFSAPPLNDSDPADAEIPVRNIRGFIEVYNGDYLLAGDYLFFENGGERKTGYFYRRETLIRAETGEKISEAGTETFRELFTDNYRYNRSGSLRFVERIYHDRVEDNTVRLGFPGRVLDAAGDGSFISEQLYLGMDFFGSYTVEAGQRMLFTTDTQGRILTQTLVADAPPAAQGEEAQAENSEGAAVKEEVLWVIKNTWSGEQIVSSQKIQGNDEWLNEYEYSSGGDRIGERNYFNGVLERQTRVRDGKEVEELLMKGVVVLRAIWEDGRKISEERIPAREAAQ